MKVTNYDVVANAYQNGVGYLTELGSYAGEYMTEAYEALGIEEELEDNEWCDLCVTRNGEIYAVYGDTTADGFGEFAFKKLGDGTEADGDLIENIGVSIAKYNVYYEGTDCVNYSIEWYKLKNGDVYVYNRHDNEATISSYDEIEEAKESYEGGYWA